MTPIEGTLRRVDRYQQRHGWLGFLFAVVKKFGDDKGGNLTTLLAWNGFFALFPLLAGQVFGAEGGRAGRGPDLDSGRDRAGHRHHQRACPGLPSHPGPVDPRPCRPQPARGILVADE